MAEQINNRKVFSLLEVNRSIRKTLEQRYGSAFWVKAEMLKLNYYPHSGHCYPDLVEKKDGRVVAQIRSNLWRTDYNRINKTFKEILREPLKDGIKILFLAKVSFDPMYGLSLQILDIDPSFTLGDLEQEKQLTIARLKKEALYDKNRQLKLPLLPKRIAVISVETSKGFADFRRVVDQNSFGYRFFYFLFPALLQGDNAVPSILLALEKIKKVESHFDMVAIIRGGGGDIGLSCYNDYDLCKAVASFPLPVITGIGHSTNETVVEMIAHQDCITPTKLGEWLIQKMHNFSVPLEEMAAAVSNYAKTLIREEINRFEGELKYFKTVAQNSLDRNKDALARLKSAIGAQASFLLKESQQHIIRQSADLNKLLERYFKRRKEDLETADRQLKLLDPVQVLRRGYSITYYNDKALKDAADIREQMEIVTRLYSGTLKSKIIQIEKTN